MSWKQIQSYLLNNITGISAISVNKVSKVKVILPF